MPVEGLPLILENTLQDILRQHMITSWTIKGGTKFSEVRIRFNMASMPFGEVKYRKEPPSRIKRDTRRASRKRNIEEEDYQTCVLVDNDNISDQTFQDIRNPFQRFLADDIEATAPVSIKQDPSPVPQVDGTTDNMHTSTPWSQDVNNITETDSVVSVCQGQDSDQNKHSESDTSSDDSVAEFVALICSFCSKQIQYGEVCRQCKLCGNIYLCKSCFDERKHIRHVTWNLDLSSIPTVPHCQICRTALSSIKEDFVYKCDTCAGYIQCSDCHVTRVCHIQHRDQMQKVTIDTILENG